MTHAERVIKVSKMEKTDRIPVFLGASEPYYISKGSSSREVQSLPPQDAAQWIYDCHNAVDSDISYVGSHSGVIVEALGGKIKILKKGLVDIEEALLKSAGDIKKFNPSAILENPKIQKLFDVTRALVMKENGERLICCTASGPFTFAAKLFTIDALMKGIYHNEEEVKEILDFSTELTLVYIQGFIDAGARMLFMPDPCASGDVISKKHFKEFALPCIKEVFRRLEGRDVIKLLHICGDTTDRLNLISESGADIMSLDHKVKLAAARDAFAGKIAFAGNLDPVNIVQFGSHDEIIKETIRGIKEAGENSPYVVMPGCGIPPATPLENLQLISKTASEFNWEKV